MNLVIFLLNVFMLAVLVILVNVIPERFIQFRSLQRFKQIALWFSSPVRSILTVFILSFVLSVVVSSYKIPLPCVQDEFGYLLTSDTFSQGRITNPTHPFWKHFESFHIFHEPTYAAKYPPGQGIFLAVGQVTTGHPIVGVWLSVAMACAAICWMLHAWVPPGWAFLGGLMATLHPLMIIWGQCYWGGAVAILGGALLFGALRRIIMQPRTSTTLIFATGLFLLAISRPFEGFLTAISAAILLVIWIVKQTQFSGIRIVRSLLVPLGAASLIIILSLGYYNYKVTGNVSRFPYQVHEEKYSPTPLFLWESPRTDLEPYNPHLQKLHYGLSLENYKVQQTGRGYRLTIFRKMLYFLYFVFVFPMGVLLLMTPWVMRDRWGRVALIIVISISLFHFCAVTFFLGHYLAPIFPLIFFILIQCARHWRVSFWKDRNRGLLFVTGLWILFVITSFTKTRFYIESPDQPEMYAVGLKRADIIKKLTQVSPKDLIIVKYSPHHSPNVEWVYNRADIDDSEIIWAHDLGQKENRKLIQYFADRDVWLLEADSDPVKLRRLVSPSS
ncbi:hypothetical protein Pan241w_26990 [Gimesia alba]|uniref:Glycosyltransferase RgtA/B/C/D-like domain-containing protein n=1 Tax=Gimesia alba TaxID=2527973 RepID=A0A517RFG3_9PLAN|nr:hypothetical protein [Gimesia alba]QDT42613.1 hypothetical protein Pan241w_26990 [Gimesia alba]